MTLKLFREHNRLARQVKEGSNSTDDEVIFQIARNILIAEMQSIVYNEYLPILLGPSNMKALNIWTKEIPKSFYKSSINPSILNSFATASFRWNIFNLNSSNFPVYLLKYLWMLSNQSLHCETCFYFSLK